MVKKGAKSETFTQLFIRTLRGAGAHSQTSKKHKKTLPTGKVFYSLSILFEGTEKIFRAIVV
ncbi:hypothetical protein C4F50_16325 [Flavobacterium sp. KB82]|uniref:Uncharacterized protein n=1 Tax=Flavobacterium hungaricum TaxID=2082725 RepID=A0ABR9TMA2_9FLAO|nr:hypothetical protein [Flavobacterium hungaricum]